MVRATIALEAMAAPPSLSRRGPRARARNGAFQFACHANSQGGPAQAGGQLVEFVEFVAPGWQAAAAALSLSGSWLSFIFSWTEYLSSWPTTHVQ